MLPSHSRDPQTKRALWLCMWEVERLYLEVPLSSGEGGLWDFEVSQQRQAQVTAVLQTGLSWDTCWEVRNGVRQPEPCLPQIIIILKRILWFRGSPSAHRQPCTLCSHGNPQPWCAGDVFSSCPPIPPDPPSALTPTPTPLFPEKTAQTGKRMQKGVCWSLGQSIVNQVWLFSDFSYMHFLIYFIAIVWKELTPNPGGAQKAQLIQAPGSKQLLKFLPQSPLSAVAGHRSSVHTEGHSEYLCTFWRLLSPALHRALLSNRAPAAGSASGSALSATSSSGICGSVCSDQ